jgi:hypothetical protein
MTFSWYTDEEIDNLCAGYERNHDKVKYLRSLGLHVERKPNGRPLVIRAAAELILAGMKAANDALQAEASAVNPPAPDRAGMVLFLASRQKRTARA